MAARLRLVEEPPDAPLDPVREIIEARDRLQRLIGNPLLSDVQGAIDAAISILDHRIPNPQPRGHRS